MKFSVIIPVFNGGATLSRCLDSVANLPDTEILLIDDGSTDYTREILREYGEKYPYFRIFHQPHRGVSAARNLGLDRAEGAYILFLDADDTLASLPRRTSCPEQADVMGLFRQDQLCQLWNKVFRAEVIRRENLRFREELFVYEDLEFVLQYLSAAGELVLAPELCCHVPSGLALGRAGRLETLGSVLDFLPEPFRQELAPILARQVLAAAPRRFPQILGEYRKYRPDGSGLRLLKEALALRWRS